MALKLEKKFQAEAVEGTDGKISGYASLFGSKDQQGDIVEPGAFADCLARKGIHEIKMLWQHDPQQPIGVWTKIAEDQMGLRVEGQILTDVMAGKEALALLKAKAVTGLSIGYRTLASGKSSHCERILKSVDLWEISLVTFPMLSSAQAQLDEQACEKYWLTELHNACAELRDAVCAQDREI